MQHSGAFLAKARRALESVDRSTRSVEAERRPWILWSISIIIALSMIGYPIASTLADLLGVDNAVMNYPYRGLIILLSIAVTIAGISMGHFRVPLLVTAFMLAYLLRLVTDMVSIDLPLVDRDTLFYVTSVLIPTIAMGAAHFYYEERNASLMFTVLGGVACFMIILSLIANNAIGGEIDLSRRNYLEALNPITIAYAGILTATASYNALSYVTRSVRLFIVWPTLVLGLLTFVLGGSRGPLVGIALFFGLQALVRGRGAIAAALLLGSLIAVTAFMFADLALFQRFVNIGNDPSVLERFYVQRLAMEQALDTPLFGSYYLELSTLSYPHNLVIEAFMALGLLGLVAMVFLQVRLFLDILTMMRVGHVLMPMIGTTALANAWISGSLFASRDFFMAIVLCGLIAVQIRVAKRVQSKRDQMELAVKQATRKQATSTSRSLTTS